jgi:exonuclease III
LGASYCRTDLLKGGSCIFVHKSIKFSKRNISKYCLDQDFEACVVKIRTIKLNVYIFSIYRAPSGNFNNFLQKLDNILKLYVSSNSEFIICGDFNINYLADMYRKNQLNSLLMSYNLFDTVGFPTRTKNSTISATDNILLDFS